MTENNLNNDNDIEFVPFEFKLGRLDKVALDLAPLHTYFDGGKLPAAPVKCTYSLNVDYPMADNNRLGDCLAPGTRLLTADLEWKDVSKLAVGDALVGFDEKTPDKSSRQYRTSIVERVERIVKPCYELTLEDGTVIVASFDHQWFRRKGSEDWITTEDLVCGEQKFSQLFKVFEPWNSNAYVTKEHAYAYGYLAGALDADGCLTFSSPHEKGQFSNVKEIHFTQRQNVMLEKMESILNTLGYTYTKRFIDGSPLSDNGYHNLIIGKKQQVIQLLGESRPPRLMGKFSPDRLGSMQGKNIRLVKKNFIGDQEVVAIQTSTRTFIAEGFASHNCVVAGHIHLTQAVTQENGGAYNYPGDAATQEEYFKLTGGADTGLVESTFLQAAKNSPILGSQIDSFGVLDPKNVDEIKSAIYVFGGAFLGVALPQSAQDQFPGTWSVVPNSPIVGGHCVVAIGYDAQFVYIVTWGQVIRCTWEWFTAYVDEAYAIIYTEEVQKNRGPLEQLDITRLRADIASL